VYCVSRYLVIILYCRCISNTCKKEIPHTLISCLFFFKHLRSRGGRQTDNSRLAASRCCCCLRGFFPFSASFCQCVSLHNVTTVCTPFSWYVVSDMGETLPARVRMVFRRKALYPIILPEPIGHPSSGSRPKSPLWVSSFFSIGIVIWTRYLHTGQMARQEFLL